MTGEENDLLLKEFVNSGAILKGHFLLSSGLHSDTYVQCAKVFENPEVLTALCSKLVKKVGILIKESIDLVVSPAIGAIIVGYEVARQIKSNYIFCERVNGQFSFRRGFGIKKGTRVLIVEDVITTGKSSLEAAKCIEDQGGVIIGEATLVKRSKEIVMPFNIISLIDLDIKNYSNNDLPKSLQNTPISKPGSRHNF